MSRVGYFRLIQFFGMIWPSFPTVYGCSNFFIDPYRSFTVYMIFLFDTLSTFNVLTIFSTCLLEYKSPTANSTKLFACSLKHYLRAASCF